MSIVIFHSSEFVVVANFMVLERAICSINVLVCFHSFLSYYSQFINDNFDYDERCALELLSAYGLKEYMFDVAKVQVLLELAF